MAKNMMLEDALNILREIATGDMEQEAFRVVENSVNAYRSLYEMRDGEPNPFRVGMKASMVLENQKNI